jgi:hypothetical protein
MYKLSHRTLIILGGLIWLFMGIFLLTIGIRFILSSLVLPPSSFTIQLMKFTLDHSQAMMLLVTTALFIGYLKGKYVLGKSAARQVARISQLENPTSLKNLYSKGYYLLILSMVGIGIAMRYLPLIEVRGAIDAAIGSALIHGALHYFRSITNKNQQKT